MWDEMNSFHSSPCHAKGCRFHSLASSLRSPLLPVISLAPVSVTFPRRCSTFPESLGCNRDTYHLSFILLLRRVAVQVDEPAGEPAAHICPTHPHPLPKKPEFDLHK